MATLSERPRPANSPLAFVSDIHGNLPALEAVLDELQRRAIVDVYVAGDLLLGGDQPVEVFKRLQQVSARCVRGTSDDALVKVRPDSLNPEGEEEKALAQSFANTRRSIGEVALKFLEKLPETIRIPIVDGSEIVMVHGSPADPAMEISHDMGDDEVLGLVDGDPADIVICGSSHVPFQRVFEEVRVVNVGSVGQAPEGAVAHYTVITPRMEGTLIEQTWVAY